jgi:anaerobic dimethyl sulfoxide reductase subunit B (iron-sulfur subunit)
MKPAMEKQFGFLFDSDRCVQCHACELACKSWNEIEFGIRWRKVLDLWSGEFPRITNKTFSLSCLHCADPGCVAACPEKAINKRRKDGIVTVDPTKCKSCRTCASACPFHIPQYGRTGAMQKCNFCLDRLTQGKEPACVATCPGEALKCGVMGILLETVKKPKARFAGPTNPSLIICGRLTEAELQELLETDHKTMSMAEVAPEIIIDN